MQLGSMTNVFRSISKGLRPIVRHHAILFTLFALVALIAAVYMTNEILSRPTDDDYRDTANQASVQTTFDRGTIQRINELRERNESSSGDLSLPAGRTNPFAN